MKKTLFYLFDPLCGWCYSITPALTRLANEPNIFLELLPTGLFSGEGAKQMDNDFAAYAWNNDQRIASLTKQKFTERYREFVLGDCEQLIDSEPATMALTAISLTDHTRELEALKAIQHARFVEGQDITNFSILVSILKSLELNAAALKLENVNTPLVEANRARINRAQSLMHAFNARGVPTFIANSGKKIWKLDTRNIYENPQALIYQLHDIEITSSTC